MKLTQHVSYLLISLIVVCATAITARAQGPEPAGRPDARDAGRPAVVAPDLAIDAGIGSPAPAGFTVLYVFTGVANESDSGNDEATSVNCTNYSNSTAVEVRVELFGSNPADVYAANQVINPGVTRTWSTQSIDAYNDGAILPSVGYIFQGSGRILTRQHTQIICNAQVLDANVDPPVYAVELDLYRR